MRIKALLLSLILIAFFSQACQKEIVDINLNQSSWVVEKIKRSGELSYESTDSIYILKFFSDTTYFIRLDVNDCGGKYEANHNGDINFEPMICTEVCCDSEFARELRHLIPKMTSFFTRGTELHLEGDGKIILLDY